MISIRRYNNYESFDHWNTTLIKRPGTPSYLILIYSIDSCLHPYFAMNISPIQ